MRYQSTIYRPDAIDKLRTPVQLLIPTVRKYNGVSRQTYPETGEIIFVNFKSYGGTETTVNGLISILDTADVVTWYRPDIKADCALKLEDGRIYEIISEPEDVEMQHMYCAFKVERVKGGA